MKKQTITLVLLCLVTLATNAQDLIVTAKKDTINGKITKIKKGMLHFNFVKNGKVTRTLLPLSDIEDYQKGFYTTSEISTAPAPKQSYKNKEKRFLFSTRAGYGYRLAKVENDIPEVADYLKKLKNGFVLGVDGHFLLSESFGVGLHYNRFASKNELNIGVGGNAFETIEDKIAINFVGPSIVTRLLPGNNDNSLNLSTSIGYMSYLNEQTIQNQFLEFKGNTIGVAANLTYSLSLSESFGLNFGLAYIGGVLTELERTEGETTRTIDLEEETGNVEGLGRVDLTFGFSFLL